MKVSGLKVKVIRVGNARSFSIVIPKNIVRLICGRYGIDPEDLEYFDLVYDGEKIMLRPWVDERRKRWFL